MNNSLEKFWLEQAQTWELTEPERERSPSAPLEPFATASQRAAVPRLEQLYQAGMRNLNFGGIKPRTKPLLVGPSGCGKSAAVRLLAGKLGLETLSVNAGSWIVYGAKQDQYTLTGIRDFVHHQWERGGLIFIDEIDKAVPRDGAPLEHWSLSVFTELLAARDGAASGRIAPTPRRLTVSGGLEQAGAKTARPLLPRPLAI
ncbi:MAG: AAA family ATPase [Verrucomicrobiales bacterium]|jgi:SpoVK/Ycf46/Vps4 family AAA+-type ATPase|nr:AAA family ATPase [Verrucomicrobiales bacterium]